MHTLTFTLAFVLLSSCSGRVSAYIYTWPNPQIDVLERMLYQQEGFDSLGPALGVSPCTTIFGRTGRTDSAEWIRTAYHDMSTANVTAGTGGIDASIGFESNRPENVGKFINETFNFLLPFQSPLSSMSDLLALATVFLLVAVRTGASLFRSAAGASTPQKLAQPASLNLKSR